MMEARVAGVPKPVSFMASESSFSSRVLPAVSIAVSRVPSVKRFGGRVFFRVASTSTTFCGSPFFRPEGRTCSDLLSSPFPGFLAAGTGRRARCSGIRWRVARHSGQRGSGQPKDPDRARSQRHQRAAPRRNRALHGGCVRGHDRNRREEGGISYRRLRAMFVKELHHITRDARSLAMALAMPMMMLLLYGYALSLDVDHILTLVYDQDGTSASRELIRQFAGSRYFNVTGFVHDYRTIERGIDTSSVLIGVVIPRGFGGELAAGKGTVQLLVDGSDSNTASIAMGYAESVVQNYSAGVRA